MLSFLETTCSDLTTYKRLKKAERLVCFSDSICFCTIERLMHRRRDIRLNDMGLIETLKVSMNTG
jgi:hypothetical protein